MFYLTILGHNLKRLTCVLAECSCSKLEEIKLCFALLFLVLT